MGLVRFPVPVRDPDMAPIMALIMALIMGIGGRVMVLADTEMVVTLLPMKPTLTTLERDTAPDIAPTMAPTMVPPDMGPAIEKAITDVDDELGSSKKMMIGIG